MVTGGSDSGRAAVIQLDQDPRNADWIKWRRGTAVNLMAAVVDKVVEIESLNGELAMVAESAWLPGEEPFEQADREAVLTELAALRTERNRLEGELDALIGGLNGGS